MVKSAILHMLQIDFSLGHFPYFNLQILKTLNTLTFVGPTVQIWLLLTEVGCVTFKILRSRAHLSVVNFQSGRFACCAAARPGNGFLNDAVLQVACLSQVSGRHSCERNGRSPDGYDAFCVSLGHRSQFSKLPAAVFP
jgi:hypothetical protein